MRYLLLLGLLLYNIVNAARPNAYDYDEPDTMKAHSFVDERRNWRKKVLSKQFQQEHKEWDDRRYEHDAPRYLDESDPKRYIDMRYESDPKSYVDVRHGMPAPEPLYKAQRRYEDVDSLDIPKIRNGEVGHNAVLSKENEKKMPFVMTCDRLHERYEACFAGCAAVTCDNPRGRLRPCYPFCEPGCVCARPHVRDDRTHKCVLPDDCSKGLKGIPDLGDDT